MNIEKFVEILTLSKLCPEQQVAELLSNFENERKTFVNDDDALDQLCHFLINAQAITEWQCNKLKVGKWKGFYFEDYLLLEQSGKDEVSASYKSRDIRDDRIVNLVIRPLNQTGGKIEYRVDPYVE